MLLPNKCLWLSLFPHKKKLLSLLSLSLNLYACDSLSVKYKVSHTHPMSKNIACASSLKGLLRLPVT
jgi:hypothetical protein